ncbi:hypothetical protein JB92DRAFT_3133324 [Gautieria morchelliformis]|nr:hypothetical protein JB92DRAFT_3133324 [Gautieria morchelliformis]
MCWQCLKTHYKIVKTLREQSGFGWNEGKKLVTASKEVWDVYILAHPKAKPFHRRSFPLFAQMVHLVDGVIATGTGVFRSSSPIVGDIDEGDDDDEELVDSGHDMLADEDGNKSSENESDEKVTPSHKSKKCKAATATKPACKRVHKSGTDAILSMSTAVTDMGAALSNQGNSSTDLCASLVHKTKAMQMVEDEEEGLTDLEAVTVAEIFMRNTAAADMYLAMCNKPTRWLWLEAHIREEIGTWAALFESRTPEDGEIVDLTALVPPIEDEENPDHVSPSVVEDEMSLGDKPAPPPPPQSPLPRDKGKGREVSPLSDGRASILRRAQNHDLNCRSRTRATTIVPEGSMKAKKASPRRWSGLGIPKLKSQELENSRRRQRDGRGHEQAGAGCAAPEHPHGPQA